MAANFGRRIAFAVVAIPVAFGLVYLGGWALALFTALVGVLGARELLGFAPASDIRPMMLPALLSAAAIAPLTYQAIASPAAAAFWASWWPSVGALWLIAMLLWVLVVRPPDGRPMQTAGIALLSVAYTGALPAFLIVLRHGGHGTMSWPGTWLAFFPLITIWICDTFAMLGGMLIGGPKLAPVVSPGKTRSGGLAGVVGALLVGVAFGWWIFPAVGVRVAAGSVVGIALVLSVVGQLGDLAESLLKRGAGVKDSGTLIPGHGGVLDRFDSLYFALPVCAVLYRVLGVA